MEGRATALVTTNITMQPTYLPYERPPDPAALWSAIPRGLRGGIVSGAALDVKPTSDQQLLTISLTLPAQFAYVFAGIQLGINIDVANDWEGKYIFNLQQYYQGLSLSSSWNLPLEQALKSNLGGETRASGAHSMDTLPSFPIYAPRGSSGILISIQAGNANNAAGSAGTVDAFINFWEFDLEQIRKYPINSPIPTHSR